MSLPTLMQRKPRRSALLLGLAIVVALFGVCEIGLRAFGPSWLDARMRAVSKQGTFHVGQDSNADIVFRNEQPLTYKPRAKFSLIHTEYTTQVSTDELGGRTISGATNRRQILPFLGDSFTFGLGVDDGETFVSKLQPIFDQRLVNLAMIGASLPHYRFVIEQMHEQLGRPPVYVIGLFVGNDLNDILRDYAEPASSLSKPQSAEGESASRLHDWNAFIEHSWIGHLYSLQFAKSLLLPFINRDRTMPLANSIFPLMENNPKYVERAYPSFEREINALELLLQKLGTRCVFILIPDHNQVSIESRRTMAAYYSIPFERLDPLAPNRGIASVLSSHHFAYVDPTLQLMDDPAIDTYYYRYDTHLTATGNAVVARLLAKQLPALVVASIPAPAARVNADPL